MYSPMPLPPLARSWLGLKDPKADRRSSAKPRRSPSLLLESSSLKYALDKFGSGTSFPTTAEAHVEVDAGDAVEEDEDDEDEEVGLCGLLTRVARMANSEPAGQ